MKILATLLGAALLAPPVLLAVPAAGQQPPVRRTVTVVQANVGNINITPGACGDQAVKLCLQPVEGRIAEGLRTFDPDVVLLQEVLPTLICAPPVKPGDFGTAESSPSRRNPAHLCNPTVAGALTEPDQVDRLLPPDRYQTRCNDPLVDPANADRVIPPWDCISVKRSVGRLVSFTTQPGTAPDAVPGQTCDNGFTVNLARLDLGGQPLQVTSAHPDSGGQRDGCRADKLTRMFAALGGDRPPVPTIVSGDFNLDPYRTSDASVEVWDRFISSGTTTPYGYRSGIAEAEPAPFSSNICGPSQLDPTGQLVDGPQPPTGPCASTLDHVASTPDLPGSCDTLGEAPGDTGRLDGGGGTDHRGIACTLQFAALADPGGAVAPAAPPAQAPPARQIDGFCINPGTSQFTDVQSSGDANANELALAVRCLATAEVAQGGPMGRPATEYGPELNVTRGQMSSFIARVIDASVAREVREPRVQELPEPAAADPFTDVPNGDIHENNIKRLSQAGVVNGDPGGIGADRFGPELPVTRGQMASFINRAVAYMEGGDPGEAGSSEENGFAAEDAEYYVDELQQVHEDNINGITSAGISQGVGGDRYASRDNVTRRQMARFLSRTLAAINVPDGDQLVLTLRELFSANFPDDDREPETRVASSPDDEPTPVNSRTYTAEGLDTEEEFRISLVESGQIERDSDDNNEVRFETDMIEGGFAVNTGMPTSRIVEVNGEEPQTQAAVGTEPTDSGPTASAVTEPEDDGTVTFTIQGEMPEDVTPVLYYNGGGDQTDFQDGGGNSPRLETDAEGRPIEFFSVAGETTFVDEGAATGSGSGSGSGGGGLPLPVHELPGLPVLLNSVSNGLLSLLD